MQNLGEANRMLDAFASVGAQRFDVTFLDIDGKKRGFRKGQTVAQLRNSLPKLLPGLTDRRNSLVVRPHAEGVTLIQLDDLDATALERLKAVAFLTLSTSPGNHQAWVAIDHSADVGKPIDIARRLRKGVGADLSASGATRVAGTLNFKEKYEPDFPTVSIESVVPRRIVMTSQLEHLRRSPSGVPPFEFHPSRTGVGRIICAVSRTRRRNTERKAPTSAGRISFLRFCVRRGDGASKRSPRG